MIYMPKHTDFTRYFYTVEPEANKKVKSIDFKLVARDFEGRIHVTDIMLQEGRMPSGYVPANKEMLKRERDANGNIVAKRHFNAVIRRKKNLGVFNRARVSEEGDLSARVTGGLDYTLNVSKDSSLSLSTLYGTRKFTLKDPLKKGDLFEFHATSRVVKINGVAKRNYSGTYHLIPGVLGLYTIDLGQGAGHLLLEVDTWLKGIGGEKL